MDLQTHRDHCFGGKTWGKRTLKRLSTIWEDNIKTDLEAHGDNCFGGKTWGKETA